MNIVCLQDIAKACQGTTILHDVNLTMEGGDFLVLFGEDDAGKTSLLHILLGFDLQYEGSLTLFGEVPPWGDRQFRERIRFVPDDILMEQHMTGRQYLRMAQSVTTSFDYSLVEQICTEFDVPVDQELMEMTYQENKLVQVIAAIGAKPELLVLDEPANFFTGQTYVKLLGWIKKCNEAGMSILMATESYADVWGYATAYAFLKEGNVIQAGKVPHPDYRAKVVAVAGGDVTYIKERFPNVIRELNDRLWFAYRGAAVPLMRGLERAQCADVVIEEMTLEEELENDFSRWE